MPSDTKQLFIITGDIGGTNSRMRCYNSDGSKEICKHDFRNEEHIPRKENEIFERRILVPFLETCRQAIYADSQNVFDHCELVVCLAVAGFVRDHNEVCVSSLHQIVIRGDAIATFLQKQFSVTVKICKIINDFVAQGFGCLTLESDEVEELTSVSYADMDPNGPKVCVGAGSGLGECFLIPNIVQASDCGTGASWKQYSCFPSEGGQNEFSPRSDIEVELWKFLQVPERNNFVSVECVVSGRGLAHCYRFLAQKFPEKVDVQLDTLFHKAGDDQGKLVAQYAKTDTLCGQAMDLMMRYVLLEGTVG